MHDRRREISKLHEMGKDSYLPNPARERSFTQPSVSAGGETAS